MWHGAAAAAARQLVVFGGAALDGLEMAVGDAMVFDVATRGWTACECAARPAARLGHGLVCLDDSSGDATIVALGGSRGGRGGAAGAADALGSPFGARKRLAVKGEAPPPHEHGVAVALRGGAAVLVICGAPVDKSRSMRSKVFCLARGADADADAWTWDAPWVMGDAPPHRERAAACLMPDGVSVLARRPSGVSEDPRLGPSRRSASRAAARLASSEDPRLGPRRDSPPRKIRVSGRPARKIRVSGRGVAATRRLALAVRPSR